MFFVNATGIDQDLESLGEQSYPRVIHVLVVWVNGIISLFLNSRSYSLTSTGYWQLACVSVVRNRLNWNESRRQWANTNIEHHL